MLDLESEVGTPAPGACADLLLVDGDPLTDVAVLAEPLARHRVAVQGGRVVFDRR